MRRTAALLVLLFLTGASSSIALADLTFEQRVEAQRAIERVYYSHQIGARMPFDEAVTGAILEAKVRAYLEKSMALERLRSTRVTVEMLQEEADRIAAHTRMPDRLRELYTALGNDRQVILECLIRPVLVERLSREASSLPGLQEIMSYGSQAAGCTGDIWDNQSLGELTPTPRRKHSAVWTGTEMIVWGGYDGNGYLATGSRYDPITDSSTPISNLGEQTARIGHRAVWTGARMMVCGGDDSQRSGGLYDPVSDSWSQTSLLNAPEERWGHMLLWTGSRVLVWGGYSFNGVAINTGGLYDPSNNTWSAMSTAGAPLLTRWRDAVWTGSRMIVYGSTDDPLGNFVNGGAIYDPQLNMWSTLSLDGAPVPRQGNATVWAGSSMIVWGGLTQFGYVNTGALYDPASNSWTPMAGGAPPGRTDSAAVWTGTRMVVWGGSRGGPPFLNSGGIYDPETQTWAPTPTAGAPAGRADHTAVWTGDQMVIWGGIDDERYLNTAARFEPARNTWLPSAALPARPAPRERHTAVWTGNYMIVWGGLNYLSNVLGSGGRYDPLLDTWTPTSLLGAPSARYWHTAVWTGTQMIIWDGIGDPGPSDQRQGCPIQPDDRSVDFDVEHGRTCAQ